jgi:hypothetical protein
MPRTQVAGEGRIRCQSRQESPDQSYSSSDEDPLYGGQDTRTGGLPAWVIISTLNQSHAQKQMESVQDPEQTLTVKADTWTVC